MIGHKVLFLFVILMITSPDVFAQDGQTLPMDKMKKSVVYLEGGKPM